jgi:uncharacterized protein (TIGR02646 family)
MRTIKKGKEPPKLETYRQKADATFKNLPANVKERIQEQLVREQRGLCCYCQSRIRETWDGMKIEHWQSQSPDKYPARQLDYSNMLGACSGGQKHGQKSPKAQHHCDTSKGDLDLCFSVCDPEHPIERKIKFSNQGVISSDDPDIDEAINRVLNLNLVKLIENRKRALTGFLEGLSCLGERKVDYSKELARWDGSNGEELPPFSQIVAHYLLRKINRRAAA